MSDERNTLRQKMLIEMNEKLLIQRKEMDEELENIRLEKAELESEKLRINEKNKLLWEQSAAIHQEKERIIQLKLEVEEALQIAVYQKDEVQRQKEEIEKQKKRSDELLLNILPEQVAEELKERGEAEAKLIDKVTVLFTDFKGFTQLSEKMTPQVLVGQIHEYFSAFDSISVKYGIEKIKTIGDAYMAAGGLPETNQTHAHDVIMAAMEINAYMIEQRRKREARGESFFEIRIGVHTGPVVAGIVGVKKFQYDIWGDTVNTASRMESAGEPGKINVSESTYMLIKDQFACEYRGEIDAKGKGKMKMYFVTHAA
jgi:class 3 adenylate cyclase